MVSPSARRFAVQAYQSPYAPKYSVPTHFHGLTLGKVTRYGSIASTFAVTAGVFALFFLGEVPRVRQDILSKVPGLDRYFDRSIPPEDNPF
ncbi:hypothetical protein VTN96DRAFT_787 [Rasamsonia emersonii]